MSHRFILLLILGIDVFMLFYQTSQLSISYDEAQLLYGDISFLQIITKFSMTIFGQNDFGLRLPMITLHLLSAILLYLVSQKYVQNARNRTWLVLIFVLLPGVMSSAIVVNSAGLVIFGLLLFLFVSQRYSDFYLYALLILLAFIESDFIYLFLSMIAYSIYIKNRNFFILNTFLLVLSISLHGLEKYSMPSGHFLDTLAIYSAVFSPIVFIYIFYILYRRVLFKDMDILWFLSSVTLIYSLLLSFRQHIAIEHFAPYVIVALPLAAQTFYSSYRVRLKMFRGTYKNIFTLSLVFLLLNSLIVIFNKEIYTYIDKPQKHFAYKMHVAKELAEKLKKAGINCISSDKKMALRLEFYNITRCAKYRLSTNNINTSKDTSVTVSYKDRLVYVGNVTNINTK